MNARLDGLPKARAALGSKRRPNLVNERFGRLVVRAEGPMKGARRTWDCLCDCGNTTNASTSDLRYGSVQSCGCMLAGGTAANARHGHSSRIDGTTKTYNSWRGMIDRCTNPNHSHYPRYGGRGISVCPEWADFENFLRDMGERPEGRSIDRINNDGNYEPSNCRWATAIEQRHNRRDWLLAHPRANDNQEANREAA